MRKKLVELIQREIRLGAKGRLIFKTNALEDRAMIRLLYEASQAGVKIDLIVRGICCLRPGVRGISDNITVRSIVGRFLEHSRIYYFGNDGDEEIYSGSPDLMPRNLDRRIELLFPVLDRKIVRYLKDVVIEKYLADTRKVRIAKPDGTYEIGQRPDGQPGVVYRTSRQSPKRVVFHLSLYSLKSGEADSCLESNTSLFSCLRTALSTTCSVFPVSPVRIL